MENSRRDLGPLPGPDINADARTYWAAAAEERLVVQCCDECGIYRFYPRPLCPDCASDQATWTEVSGQGSVHTFTIVHRAPNKEFQAITPYVIALIDLDEGPRMMANIWATTPLRWPLATGSALSSKSAMAAPGCRSSSAPGINQYAPQQGHYRWRW